MSRDQRPGKVRIVNNSDRRQLNKLADVVAQDSPPAAGRPTAKGVSLMTIILCLAFGLFGGVALVTLAPALGLGV
jgi:hypothetical protein